MFLILCIQTTNNVYEDMGLQGFNRNKKLKKHAFKLDADGIQVMSAVYRTQLATIP